MSQSHAGNASVTMRASRRGLFRVLRLVAGAVALMLATAVPVSADGEYWRFRTLLPSQYTNGVEKSFLVGWSFSKCATSVQADVELTIYYDYLSASRIRITKAKAKYYIGPHTDRLHGGPLLVSEGSASDVSIGTNQGDALVTYAYDSRYVDKDGYSWVGTYWHVQTLNIYPRYQDGRPYIVLAKAAVEAQNTSCTTGFNDLYVQVFLS